MSKTVTLTKVSSYRKGGTGNKVAVFAVSGSKEAVAAYVAKKEAELGSCPMIDGTTTPRHSALEGRFPAKSYKAQEGRNGNWSIIDDSNAAQLKDMIAQENDPFIKAELCKQYAAEVLKNIGRGVAVVTEQTQEAL